MAFPTLPALPVPELRVDGETFEERMSRFRVPKESKARKVLFEEFQDVAAAVKNLGRVSPDGSGGD